MIVVIRPDFTPAKISSTGGLNLTAQNINGSSLHLHADQVLELSYHILEVLLTTEYYNLPVHKKQSLFSTKVSGGAVPSTKGNIFYGGQGVILNSNGHTHLQNVVFTGRRPVYNLDQTQLLIETLNPESHLYSYRKMSFAAQLAIAAVSYYGAAFLAPMMLGASAGALATAVTRGALQGAISAGLSGGNILQSALQSGALAGIGGISARYGTMLNAAVQASASHIINGSHFGHNLFANVISGSAGVGASPELTSMQRIINGVVSDVILSAVSKRSLEDTIKSGILNAVGTIAAQHGEAMGTRIAQRQAITAYKSAPAAAQAAPPTKTKASAKLAAPAETSMFQVEPLTSATPSTNLTNTISSAIDRDLGHLVNPNQVATKVIATSTTVHRRVLGNNPTNTHSVNAVYGRDSNQNFISLINYQAPYGLQVQEMSRMHGGGIAAGYDNTSTFTMGQSNVSRQTSFVGRTVNKLVNLVPAAHASTGGSDPVPSSSAQITNNSISNSTQTGYVRKVAGQIGKKINQYLAQNEKVATAVKVAGATSDALLKLTIYTGARLTGHSEQQACQQVARFDQELSEAVHIVANRYNLTQDEMVGFTAMVGVGAPAIGPALRLTGKGGKYLVQRTPAALNFSANLAKRTANAVQEFVVTHDFRSPILIQNPKGTMLYSFPGGVVDGIKFRNPVKLKLEFKNSKVNAKIKESKLPTDGPIRFIPKKVKGAKSFVKGENNGYIDKFENEWTKGPSRTAGEPFEWDVQLSRTGQAQLGHLSRDGKHINVSLTGKITHR